jgi:YfiH family protein
VFFWRKRIGDLGLAFTDRHGGVSVGPYAQLNLAGHVGDAAEAVEANRARIAQALGLAPQRLVGMNQCHGDTVHLVNGPWPGAIPPGDAVVTTASDLALMVLVADCVPVLLFDGTAGIVAAVHAGRRGLTAGIVPRAVQAMSATGATRVEAVVGPSVCGRCYEVPESMRDEAAQVAPPAATVSRDGAPAVDVAAGVAHQLGAAGVTTTVLPGCTRERPDLYSYRASPTTGRFAAIIVRYADAAAGGS